MVMKAYSVVTKGNLVITDNFGNVDVQRHTVDRRALGNVTSRKGNYKSPNPHSYSAVRSYGLTGQVRTVAGLNWISRTGAQPYVFNWTLYDEPLDQNIYNKALKDVYDRIRGQTDVSVDLMQWRQVHDMVRIHKRLVAGIARHAKHMIAKTAKTERALRLLDQMDPRSRRYRRQLREVKGAVSTLARARLEFVYGWKPTVDTLQSLAKGVLRGGEVGMIRCRGRGSSYNMYERYQYSVSPKVPLKMNIVMSQRCEIVCYFNPRPGLIDNLSRVSSLNPISVAYELIPFSFVLDWTVDFGGFLRTLESAFIYGNVFVGGYTTRTKRLTVEARMYGRDATSTENFTLFQIGGTGVKTDFSRSNLSAAPLPTRPTIELDFGLGRTLNALSLAVVQLPKIDRLIRKFK